MINDLDPVDGPLSDSKDNDHNSSRSPGDFSHESGTVVNNKDGKPYKLANSKGFEEEQNDELGEENSEARLSVSQDAPTLIQRPSRNMEDAYAPESGNRIEMKSSYPDEAPDELLEKKITSVSAPQGVDEQVLPEQDSLPESDNLAGPSSLGADDAQSAQSQLSAEEQKRADIIERLQNIKATIAERQQKYKQTEDALQQDNLDDALQAAREAGINPYDPFAPFERMKRELARAQGYAEELNQTAQSVRQNADEIQPRVAQAQENLNELKTLDERAKSKAGFVQGKLSDSHRQLEALEKLVQPAEENAYKVKSALDGASTNASTLKDMVGDAEEYARTIGNNRNAAQLQIQELTKWSGVAQSAVDDIHNARVDIENVIKREMAMQAVQQFTEQAQQSPTAWMNPSTLLVALRQLENLISQIDEISKQRLQESLKRLQDSVLSADLKKYGSLDEKAVEEWDTYLSNWLRELK